MAPAPSGSSKKRGSSLELNCLQSHLFQVPVPRLQSGGASLPPPSKIRAWDRLDWQAGTHSPVWMMMCLDRSPTFTKALLHTLHLWGRMLSWWRM